MPLPPFRRGRRWRLRASHARQIDRRVWYDATTGYECLKDPTLSKGTWHEIDWRRGYYRELDGVTGLPVQSGEGEWRPLR